MQIRLLSRALLSKVARRHQRNAYLQTSRVLYSSLFPTLQRAREHTECDLTDESKIINDASIVQFKCDVF